MKWTKRKKTLKKNNERIEEGKDEIKMETKKNKRKKHGERQNEIKNRQRTPIYRNKSVERKN